MRTILKFNLLNTKKDLWFRLMVVPFVGLITPLLTDVVPDGDAWGVTGENETSAVARIGKVGVGSNTAPTETLDVTGTFRNTTGGRFVVQGSQDGGTGRGIYMWSNNNSTWGIYMGQSGTTKSLSGGSAPAGAGFNAHAIRFRVQNGATNGFIFENTSGTLLSSIRGSDGLSYFRGNVGIGSTSPSQKLHVVGGARITSVPSTNGNATSDRVVTVDGSGNLRSLPASSFGSSGPSISHAGRINSAGTILGGSGFTVTKIGTGDYRINFSSTMANANYIIQLTVASQAGSRNDAPIITYGSQGTSNFRVYIGDSDNGESDLFRFDSEFMFTVITQ